MRRENPIERSHLKNTFSRRNPPQFVLPFPQLIRIQAAVERGQHLHLPVMYQASKHNVPLYGTVGTLHIVCNGRLSESSNAKETKNVSLRAHSPHQTSSQKLILDPIPGSNLNWHLKFRHPIQIYFQSPTPCD
jgi:hypothetical protein